MQPHPSTAWPEVVVCGRLVADIRVRPFHPVRPGTPGSLHSVDELRLTPGGIVANTGLALARLGLSTAAAGRLGDDALGDAVYAALAAGGLHVDHVVRQAATPSTS